MPSTGTVVEFSDAELRLLHNALTSYLSDFGHDQSDLIHEVKLLLARLDATAGQPS